MLPLRGAHLPIALIALLAVLLAPRLAAAQDDLEGLLPDYNIGLVAEYTDGTGRSVRRVDEQVQFRWGNAPPDARLAAGPFSARWQGLLYVLMPGHYQLHVFCRGAAEVRLGGELVIDAGSQEPQWHSSPSIELQYGYQPLEIAYQGAKADAELRLFWSGPQFQLEPVPDRHLMHEPSASPENRFEEGRLLTRALRCSACHQVEGETEPVPAPALTHLRDNISRAWVIDWISAHAADEHKPKASSQDDAAAADPLTTRRMPHFALSRGEAADVADYLLAASKKSPAPEPYVAKKTKAAKGKEKPRTEPSAAAGERLAQTIGCLACHQVGELGAPSIFGGGDLTHIADKRSSDFLARWLQDPALVNVDHRMPVFPLEPLQRADLLAYLSGLSQQEGEEDDVAQERTSREREQAVARGRKLVREQRCNACHRLPGDEPPADVALLPLKLRDGEQHAGCLGAPNGGRRQPGYALSPERQQAVRTYLTELQPLPNSRPARPDGRFILQERNCVACHTRGQFTGIAITAEAVTQAHPELAPLLPALAPPALHGVGDKLTREALHDAIELKHPPLRAWLEVRMPKFSLSDGEMQALLDHLIESDRIPPGAPQLVESSSADDATLLLAGRRLVTSDGFGCTSCHQIGESVPAKVTLANHGTDLSLLGQRLRKPWFDRWVRNPARIVPKMEMPAIQMPIKGVLASDVDEQLESVWRVLNEPGFTPPLPNPIRVVRARNVPELEEGAVLLTDVIELDGTQYLRPLVVGLPNRHNVLLDLESARLAAWWIGDAARQRTRGKSWFWEAGNASLLPGTGPAELLLVDAEGSLLQPELAGQQFLGQLDSFMHTASGMVMSYRLRYPGEHELSITQTIEPLAAGEEQTTSGFTRRIELRGVPSGYSVQLLAMPGESLSLEDGRTATLASATGEPRVRVVEPAESRWLPDRPQPWLSLGSPPGAQGDAPLVCTLEYRVDLPLDQFPVDVPPVDPPTAVKLDVAPGWQAVQLPLPYDEMPTGLAFQRDGTLVICSLKGRVLLARDTDGDGLQDAYTVVSDELSAPYGVAVAEEDGREVIDVVNKYALLRLVDVDGDDRADRTRVLADGWGYTVDYHDWAVGLPRDEQGNYYVALPCQQDDRSERAAYLRGETLKLVPPSPSAPGNVAGRWRIERLTGGHRFPMGLALSHAGDLFVTDNQGNYTPFNELNHLVAGNRYGFINKLEVRPGFDPEYREPAINIPHPPTRSVNGICFLYTPPAVQQKLGHSLFGPLEGQLIGCEYNEQRLYRMSLERVGETFQGAIYPFDVIPQASEPGQTAPRMEGPVVCAVGPEGDLYIGNLRDSAWGGGNNTGSVVRMRPAGEFPPGIAEMRSEQDGFTLDFFQSVDAARGAEPSSYSLVAYRRERTPQYGGDDIDRHAVRIKEVRLADDARQARLITGPLKKGYVYELHVEPIGQDGQSLHPAEAYFTVGR